MTSHDCLVALRCMKLHVDMLPVESLIPTCNHSARAQLDLTTTALGQLPFLGPSSVLKPSELLHHTSSPNPYLSPLSVR